VDCLCADDAGRIREAGGQAANNTKEKFAKSPDLKAEILNAVMSALDAHTAMSTQALSSETVRDGLKEVLLGPARLYEALREQATSD
jgi:type I restriction enzyme R subunit